MCEFQSLYFGDDGYVVKCNDCNHYQLAFASTMLTLDKEEFSDMCHVVKQKLQDTDLHFPTEAKCFVIPTAAKGAFLLLTRKEAARLYEILEEADNEEKALTLMSLFHA
jgi:hypothetical protein